MLLRTTRAHKTTYAFIGLLALSACGSESAVDLLNKSTADILNEALINARAVSQAAATQDPYTLAPAQAKASMTGIVRVEPTAGSNRAGIQMNGRLNVDADFSAGSFTGNVDTLARSHDDGSGPTIDTEYDGVLAVDGTFSYPRLGGGAMTGTITGTIDDGTDSYYVDTNLIGDVYDTSRGLGAIGSVEGTIGGLLVDGDFAISE